MEKHYAIRKGNVVDIISGTWEECEPKIKEAISGYSNPEWKGFKTKKEAEDYLNAGKSEADNEENELLGGSPEYDYMDLIEDPEDENDESDAGRAAHDKEFTKYNSEAFSFDSDAVIFVDGSMNWNNTSKGTTTTNSLLYYATSSIIIFYKDGTIDIETAKLYDLKDEYAYVAIRRGISMDAGGKWSDVNTLKAGPYSYEDIKGADKNYFSIESDGLYHIDSKQREHGFVISGANVAGETEAARRAFEMALGKGCRSVDIFYDCDQVAKSKVIFNSKSVDVNNIGDTNSTRTYAINCQKLKESGLDKVTFHHCKSHGTTRYIKCIFNDLADVLCKSETFDKKIGASEEEGNPNLYKYKFGISAGYGLMRFQDKLEVKKSDDATLEQIENNSSSRCLYAYELAKSVVCDERIRPSFK